MELRSRSQLRYQAGTEEFVAHQSIHPERILHHRDTCLSMFMAVLVTIARKEKQHSFPSADEQIIKLWYNRFYSAIEEKES